MTPDRLDQAVEALKYHFETIFGDDDMPCMDDYRRAVEIVAPFLRSPADEPSEEALDAMSRVCELLESAWSPGVTPTDYWYAERDKALALARAALRAAAESREATDARA